MRVDQATRTMDRLKAVLHNNKGDSDVYLTLTDGDEELQYMLPSALRVSRTSSQMDLKASTRGWGAGLNGGRGVPAAADVPRWVSAETEEKRSRFIPCAARSPTRYPDFRHRRAYCSARHHCSAYILHVDAANPVERSSDDGEPAGTAGQPMLEMLRGTGLQDIAVVVVRYFGGVKLGTGGLVRAYQDATRAVLKVLPVVTRQPGVGRWTSTAVAGKVEAEVRGRGVDDRRLRAKSPDPSMPPGETRRR